MRSFLKNISRFLYLPAVLPLLMALWGIFSSFFLEHLPANNGLGWDGLGYANMCRYLLDAPGLDTYYALRIYPCLLVNTFSGLLGYGLSDTNVVFSFFFLNTLSLVLAVIFFRGIADKMGWDERTYLFAFTLVFISYGVLNWTFYYPVLTDAFAFMLALGIFYFWVSGNSFFLLLFSFLGAYSWPILFYQGLALFLFPLAEYPVQRPGKAFSVAIRTLILLIYGAALIYYLSVLHYNFVMRFTINIQYEWLWLSIPLFLFMIWFAAEPLVLFPWKRIFKILPADFWPRLFVAVVCFLGAQVINAIVTQGLRPSEVLTTEYMLPRIFLGGLTLPLSNIVSHLLFFGSAIFLILFFWKGLSERIVSLGPGLVFALMLNLFFVGFGNHSRTIINFIPWLLIVLVPVLKQRGISKGLFTFVVLFNLLVSQLWLHVGFQMTTVEDMYGCIDFPNQLFMMNMGLWMTIPVWKFLVVLFVIIGVLFYFFLRGERLKGSGSGLPS